MPRRATKTSYGQIQGNRPKGDDQSRPGPGRPDDAIRARARESWGQRIYRLEQIADGVIKKADISKAGLAIAALRELRAVGLPDRHEHTGEDGGPITVNVVYSRE